jgi:hypothetical protein
MGLPVVDSSLGPVADNRAARYRAVSRPAVASLVAGGLSLLVALHWCFLLLPLLAFYLGRRALKEIARTPEEFTGENLAWIGIGLATVFTLLGGGWLLSARAREVPFGYQKVDYAELQPDPAAGDQVVPATASDLNDKKVFIKGYIVPGRQQVGLRRFRLCPTNGVCTFCIPNPKPTEIIQVTLSGDLTTDYTTQLIGIGGRFHVDPDDPHHLPYSMDADCVRD